MLAKDLLDFRAQLQESGIIFAYCGYVTEPVLTGVGDALKQKLAIEDMDTKTARSVFAVFVEQMQNIIRYSAETDGPDPASDSGAAPELRYGVMTVSRAGDKFIVKAGNLVDKADVEPLRTRLGQIRAADKGALKAMYKETLKGEPEEGSKGAGIGFIEIARRSSKPIAFDFTEVDERFAFFALEAEVERGRQVPRLKIAATERSPEVDFDFDKHCLRLRGESYPEDAAAFYGPVFEALDDYLSERRECAFEFELVYFNSSSAKAIMSLLERLDEAARKGKVTIVWYYDEEDDTMRELGEEFGEDLEHAAFHIKKRPVAQ
jgi:SiaC family regulatory phosphoprotein/Family of unknown function (DUF6272)